MSAPPSRRRAALRAPGFEAAVRKKLAKDFPHDTAKLFRQMAIERTREIVYRHVGAVQGQLERTAGGLFRAAAPETHPSWRPSPSVQVCWLNRTMRTFASGRALADVVGDPSVARVDVPHRLSLDMSVTMQSIRAAAYRAQHSVDGASVVVAVIDMEVDDGHPALAGRVQRKRNYTQEAWGSPGDHGTAVAGIIAGASAAAMGVAPRATIFSYKIFATDDSSADDFYGSKSLEHALEDMADIANCSWGAGPATDGTSREARACDTAWDHGLVIVKSAGNQGPGTGTLTTPADARGVIVVGGTNRQGTSLGSYSSRGPTGHGVERPHLVAPGGTPAVGMQGCLPGGSVGGIGHGTSYAAPHVSGAAALLLQRDPTLSPDAVRSALRAACRKLPGLTANEQGAGLLEL